MGTSSSITGCRNGAWSKSCDTRRRKGGQQGKQTSTETTAPHLDSTERPALTVLSPGPRLAGKPSKGEKWCHVRSQRNGENWRFFSSAQSAISRRFKHRTRSESFNLPCVASAGCGWRAAPYRAPFFIGATQASCEFRGRSWGQGDLHAQSERSNYKLRPNAAFVDAPTP